MKFEELYARFHAQPWFDLASVKVLFSTESEASMRTALYRLAREGKILALRRGLYCFKAPYAHQAVSGPALANALYRPSYLTERWALSWYGIIPEKARMYTSVSPKPTKSFNNELGEFRYRSIKQALFGGYTGATILGNEVQLACPEKALLDLWYLEPGDWTLERLASWRISPGLINTAALRRLAEKYIGQRMERAVSAWANYIQAYDEGEAIE